MLSNLLYTTDVTREGNTVVVPAFNEQGHIAATIEALSRQAIPPEAIVIVNNHSTDSTPDIVETLQRRQANIHLVQEDRKGLAYACNTGFRYAIDEVNAGIISRVDADTRALPGWNEAVLRYFADHPDKQLLTGPSYPLRDEAYRRSDSILWLAAQLGYRVLNLATTQSLFPLKVIHGHNFAVRGEAFDEVGGFPDATWEECSDSIELSRRIYEHYGFGALGYSTDMKVMTSMRRVRSAGYLALARARGNMAGSPSYSRLMANSRDIDVR